MLNAEAAEAEKLDFFVGGDCVHNGVQDTVDDDGSVPSGKNNLFCNLLKIWCLALACGANYCRCWEGMQYPLFTTALVMWYNNKQIQNLGLPPVYVR